MELGLHLPNSGALANEADLVGLAVGAEAIGFRSVWVYDHIFTPVVIDSTYPRDDGVYANAPSWSYHDALTTLSVVAGATRTIKLGTRVLIPVYRNPVVLAKQLATLQTLSNGRLLLGVGAGWMGEEFDVVGVPLEERYQRLTEHVALMRQAWDQGISQFDGKYYQHPQGGFFPKPAGLPVILGGFGEGTLRRVAKWADGWAAVPKPGSDELSDLAERLTLLRRYCEEAGRDFDSLLVVVGAPVTTSVGHLEKLADLGVDMVDIILSEPAHLDLELAGSLFESWAAAR